MAKRQREETDTAKDAPSPPKKAKHGFRVGPANLPDGPWKRQAAKKKQDLIHKAKTKKAYAKIKASFESSKKAPPGPAFALAEAERDDNNNNNNHNGDVEQGEDGNDVDDHDGGLQTHPARQAILDQHAPSHNSPTENSTAANDSKPPSASTSAANTTTTQRAYSPPAFPADHASSHHLHKHQQEDQQHQPQQNPSSSSSQSQKKKRPGYFDRAHEAAAALAAQRAERQADRERQAAERDRKLDERRKVDRIYNRARGLKADGREKRRSGGPSFGGKGRKGGKSGGGGWKETRGGRPKLGLESKALINKVRKLVGES